MALDYVVAALEEELDGMTEWLAYSAPGCEASQKQHLEEGVERAYWHYGYVCGGRDFLALV